MDGVLEKLISRPLKNFLLPTVVSVASIFFPGCKTDIGDVPPNNNSNSNNNNNNNSNSNGNNSNGNSNNQDVNFVKVSKSQIDRIEGDTIYFKSGIDLSKPYIVSTDGDGFLKERIGSPKKVGGLTEILTKDVSINKVVSSDRLIVSTSSSFDKLQNDKDINFLKLNQPFNKVLYHDENTLVTASGNVDVRADFTMLFRNENHKYQNFEVVLDGAVSSNIRVEAFSDVSKEFDFAIPLLKKSAYFYNQFGPLPVVSKLDFEISLVGVGSVGAIVEGSANASGSYSLRVGAKRPSGSWEPISEKSSNINANLEELCFLGDGVVMAGVASVASLRVYGLAGPSIGIMPYLGVVATGEKCFNQNGQYEVGLQAGLTAPAEFIIPHSIFPGITPLRKDDLFNGGLSKLYLFSSDENGNNNGNDNNSDGDCGGSAGVVALYESEPNNTPESANTFNLTCRDYSVRGTISLDDTDYYKFEYPSTHNYGYYLEEGAGKVIVVYDYIPGVGVKGAKVTASTTGPEANYRIGLINALDSP